MGFHMCCHDLNIGFTTKAKAWKGVDQECNLGITLIFTFLRMQESEGMNTHTFKWAPNLKVEVLMDSKFSKSNLKGQNSLD
jgi:hypothetical protein